MSVNGSLSDLTAFEGPDDWVSLYLDGVGDNELLDAELSTISPDHPLLSQEMADVSASATASDRLSGTPEGPQAGHASFDQDLSLPSLDELLADSSVSDPEGLFSGFQTLSNKDLDMSTYAEDGVSHSHQHSNAISGTASATHSQSEGSDGEMSQADAQTRASQTLHSQAVPAQAELSPPVSQPTGSTLPSDTGVPNASFAMGQQALPSLVGMTAAEVAQTLGYSAANQPQSQHGKNNAPFPAAQVPVRKQANGKKKRGRETEVAATNSGASEQNAASTGAAEMASRAGSPGVSSSNDASPSQVQQAPNSSASAAADGEDQKRMARMQRNRESAHQSRQRKRMQMDEVEQRYEQLKQHNSQLNQLVGRLTAENMGLKQQLVNVCQQTGHPLPPPPPSPMHPYGFGHMGVPLMVPAPKVPIQKMPAARPMPASSQMPSGVSSQQSSQHPADVQSSGQPAKARKRAKQAAGAGTVLLALFSFVIFLGPLGPMAGPRLSGTAPDLGHLGSTQVVLTHDSASNHMGGGRVLMAVDSNTSDEHTYDASLQDNHPLVLQVNDTLLEEALIRAEGTGESLVDEQVSGQGKIAQPPWWPGMLEAAHVERSKAIVVRPSNKVAESQALQGLKDLAPVALYSHWDQGPNQARLPPGQSSWQHALPDTVQEDLSGLNGFRSPSMCKEVFQFGAQETTAVQATQHVQRFLTGGSSMRGSGSIALPPIPIPKDLDKDTAKKPRKAIIGCEDNPGVVVSVMLPTKAEGSADNEFTSLDQLYVVVLTPGVKYSTYSCLLPKPVLV